MKFFKPVCSIVFFTAIAGIAYGQKNAKTLPEKCGTMQNLALQFEVNPASKQKFEEERSRFNKALRAGAYRLTATQGQPNGNRTYINIPIVFHIVVPNQALVTDAQVLAQ